jgi:hypothetical protein
MKTHDDVTWLILFFQLINTMPAQKMQRLYQLCLENIVHNANFWLQVKHTQEKTGLFNSPFDSLRK